ncbi:RNA polymerase sigma factor RpoD/SigA [Rhodocytophaga aerolata]|uniref:RNA polymerase sigma factor RpoD/SigA n=1 Tax=Rhodocytophaga aerolata TaxID=455078 RepID=A0ABT8R3V0_9BACT|nr:RNA polymerase sigma factor RpoD/SigA [Rhodocytophaga aerolata]MDO1446351.1 RNA polymerase sigma factor RpoD/SigA [Rhodocytophaga aerolata]
MKNLHISKSITNRDSSTVEKYFNEIAKMSLLTREQENDLARRIKQGDERALEKLVKANLRFVVSVAKQYHTGQMPLNDLINEGNLGLIKAAKLFDETKGYKFISYAVWWIRQSIMQALDDHSRIVRIPSHRLEDQSKLKQALVKMEQKFEREPTHEELAEFLGVNISDIKSASTAVVKQSSLNAPFEEEDGNTLLDVMNNPDAAPADAALAITDSLRIELDRVLATLSSREREILLRLFGIGYDYPQTMEDIADTLQLTEERVRQIKEGALKKIRATNGIRLLQTFIS